MGKTVDMYGAITYYRPKDLIETFIETLPTEEKKATTIWTDGDEILCKTEDLADIIADVIDNLVGDSISHIGYYDPDEDKRDHCIDDHTGWWYVDFD